MFYKEVEKMTAARILKMISQRSGVYVTEFKPYPPSDEILVRATRGVTDTSREITLFAIGWYDSSRYISRVRYIVATNGTMMESINFWHEMFGDISHVEFKQTSPEWFLHQNELAKRATWTLVIDNWDWNRSQEEQKTIWDEDKLDEFMGAIICDLDDRIIAIREQMKPLADYAANHKFDISSEISYLLNSFVPTNPAAAEWELRNEFFKSVGNIIAEKMYFGYAATFETPRPPAIMPEDPIPPKKRAPRKHKEVASC